MLHPLNLRDEAQQHPDQSFQSLQILVPDVQVLPDTFAVPNRIVQTDSSDDEDRALPQQLIQDLLT
jgi:hypothetical protein